MSSCEMTKIGEAVRDNVCSVFETDVTCMFIRSSILRSVRSVGRCCGHMGVAIAASTAQHNALIKADRERFTDFDHRDRVGPLAQKAPVLTVSRMAGILGGSVFIISCVASI